MAVRHCGRERKPSLTAVFTAAADEDYQGVDNAVPAAGSGHHVGVHGWLGSPAGVCCCGLSSTQCACHAAINGVHHHGTHLH